MQYTVYHTGIPRVDSFITRSTYVGTLVSTTPFKDGPRIVADLHSPGHYFVENNLPHVMQNVCRYYKVVGLTDNYRKFIFANREVVINACGGQCCRAIFAHSANMIETCIHTINDITYYVVDGVVIHIHN